VGGRVCVCMCASVCVYEQQEDIPLGPLVWMVLATAPARGIHAVLSSVIVCGDGIRVCERQRAREIERMRVSVCGKCRRRRLHEKEKINFTLYTTPSKNNHFHDPNI